MSSNERKAPDGQGSRDEWIDKCVRETRSEQAIAAHTNYAKPDPPKAGQKKQLTDWSGPDVEQWLEHKNLHKFILMFQKHHVTGAELSTLSLPFLENYEHITGEERELLLSEIYKLHNPSMVTASEEDLTKIRRPADRHKYLAAVELAGDPTSLITRASSVLVLPTQTLGRSQPGLTSQQVKPRHKSESGVDPGAMSTPKFERQLLDAKRRKTGTKTSWSGIKTLYESIKQLGPSCVQCLQLSPLEHSDVVMANDTEGHVTIETVPSSLCNKLHPGDRVLEINGHTVRPHLQDCKTHLAAMLNYKSPATVVVLTDHVADNRGDGDARWDKLHSILVKMRDAEDLPVDSPALPSDQEYLRHTNILQEEIRRLEDKVRDQQRLRDSLQTQLEDKEAMMHDLEVSRDKAIEKLRQTRNTARNKNTRENIGGNEYFNMTMETLNLHSASKEEVVESMREIVKEASKQKWYLDRLISLVIEESPWLLDEVDSEFDNLALTDETEEFC